MNLLNELSENETILLKNIGISIEDRNYNRDEAKLIENDIIEDIKAAGFSSTDTYVTPNQYEIAIKNLRQGQNDRGYINEKKTKIALNQVKGWG